MKKLILLAGAAALASCGGGSDDVAVDNTLTVDDTAMTADDGTTTTYVGTHTVYDADGNLIGTTVANADGSYSDSNADGTTGAGTWELNDAGQLCFQADGEDAPTCWTKGDTVDGREAWSNADGETVYVEFN